MCTSNEEYLLLWLLSVADKNLAFHNRTSVISIQAGQDQITDCLGQKTCKGGVTDNNSSNIFSSSH